MQCNHPTAELKIAEPDLRVKSNSDWVPHSIVPALDGKIVKSKKIGKRKTGGLILPLKLRYNSMAWLP